MNRYPSVGNVPQLSPVAVMVRCVAVIPGSTADSCLLCARSQEKGIVFETEDSICENRDVLQHREGCLPVSSDLAEPLIELVIVVDPVPVADPFSRRCAKRLFDAVKVAVAGDKVERCRSSITMGVAVPPWMP